MNATPSAASWSSRTPHRDDTVDAAQRVIAALRAAGRDGPCWLPTTATSSAARRPSSRASRRSASTCRSHDIELAIVLGGDGTILRAAELVREGTAPVLGINMGHVGFLAEIERDDMDDAVQPRHRPRLRTSKSASHCRCG